MQVDIDQVLRYEKLAAANPTSFRRRVALFAVLADATLVFTTLLPAVVGLGVVVVFYRQPLFTAIAIGTLLMFAWFLRPTISFKGTWITDSDAPELYSQIQSLKEKLDVPGRMKVLVTDEFNASAYESRGWFGLIGVQRVLSLGMPLMAVLSKQDLLAVIAHEMGHFSRRHGKLGHWIYRARLGWLHYAESTDEDTDAYSRAIGWYARLFLPRFNAMCFVHSRACEYEADADAAFAIGAQATADALAAVHMHASFIERVLPKLQSQWLSENPEIPNDFYLRISRAAADWSENERQQAIDIAMAEKTGYRDTHPALADRLGALALMPTKPRYTDCAGEQLIRPMWPKLCDDFSREWAKQHRANWMADYFWQKDVIATQSALTPEDTAKREAMLQIELTSALQMKDDKLRRDTINALAGRFPGNPILQFHVAHHKLLDGNTEVETALAGLWKTQPPFRLRISRLLADHFARAGKNAETREWEAKLKSAVARRHALQGRSQQEFRAKAFTEAKLLPSFAQFLRDVLAAQGVVKCAWMLQKSLPLLPERTDAANDIDVYIFWLVIDTAACTSQGLDEEDIGFAHQQILERVTGWFCDVQVMTSYTTEVTPPALDKYAALFDPENTAARLGDGRIRIDSL